MRPFTRLDFGIWPGETCGAPFTTAPLKETTWRLGEKPVILGEKQREPSLVFGSQPARVTGFGGCNNLSGGYQVNGAAIRFGGIAATRRACINGMDGEAALFKALAPGKSSGNTSNFMTLQAPLWRTTT